MGFRVVEKREDLTEKKIISYRPTPNPEDIPVLNLRQIDKFALSGGWISLKMKTLADLGFKAVLDLQFTPDDDINPRIVEKVTDAGMEYERILFYDAEYNVDLEGIFEEGYEILDAWDKKYQEKDDKLLIKCGAGISRSVAMLCNYYCISRRMSYQEAADYIRSKKNPYDISPQFGILYAFQKHLQTKFPDSSSAFGEKE